MGRFMSVCGAVVLSGLFVPAGSAQIVQTPRLNSFSTRNAVRVPDRGGVRLGGIRRSFRGNSQHGVPLAGHLPGWNRLFGNRALGGGDSSVAASVHVTVIDHESLDQHVLAEAERRRAERSNSASETARAHVTDFSRRLSRDIESMAEQAEGLMSVAEIRRRNARDTKRAAKR